jgi:recombination protein RecT
MNQVATRNPVQELLSYLDNRLPDFKLVSAVENEEKFARIMKNAILRDPEIAQASPKSVFLECQKACYDGVMLDGREAVLTRFKTNRRVNENGKWRDNWVLEVAYIPMVRGIQKRIRNTGLIAVWEVSVVYQKEAEPGPNGAKLFTFTKVPADVRHEPYTLGDPGPIIGAYSYVKFKDGSTSIEFMRKDQIDGIMGRTKSKKPDGTVTGPWATDYGRWPARQ